MQPSSSSPDKSFLSSRSKMDAAKVKQLAKDAKEDTRRMFNRMAHKVEAAALGMNQGFASLADKLAPGSDAAMRSSSPGGVAPGPPQMMSAPSQHYREPIGAIHAALERNSAGVDQGGLRGPGAGEAGEQEVMWWGPDARGCDYLGICVREAKGLPVTDFDIRSTSSYVKVRLDAPMGAGAVGLDANPNGKGRVLAEAATRKVYRTRSPMWEQSFFFPMSSLSPDTELSLAVHGLTSSINLVDSTTFSGHVHSTLGHLLCHMKGPMQPHSAWYQLCQRRSSDRVSGQLLVTVLVVPAEVHATVHQSEDRATLLDPQVLHALLHSYALNIQLHGVRSLRLPPGSSPDLDLANLSLQVKIGLSRVRVPLSSDSLETVTEGGSVKSHTLKLQQLVPCALSRAFQTGPKWGKRKKERDEIGDVRISLRAGKQVLASTQVPVWDLPVCVQSDEIPEPQTQSPLISAAQADLWRKKAFSSMVHSLSTDSQGGSGSPLSPKTEGPQGSKEGAAGAGAVESGPAASPPSDPDAAGVVPIVTGLAMMRAFMRRNPGPQGFRYKRVMESRSIEVVGCPEVDMSLSLVPYDEAEAALQAQGRLEGSCKGGTASDGGGAGQAAATGQLTEGGEREAGAAAPLTPISLPPALSVTVDEVTLMCRPLQVFDLVFKPDSSFRAKMVAKEELRDVVTGSWSPDPALASSSGYKGAQSRSVTYVRPLSIPVPMAPKQCNVTEVQQLFVKEAGGFVVETKVTTSAPKGDTFFVLIQWAATALGDNSTRVRVSFKVEFVKSVGLLKGAVQGGAVSSTKQLMQAWVDELVKDTATSVVATLVEGLQGGAATAALAATPTLTLAPAHTAAALPQGPSWGGLLLQGLLLIMALTALGLVVWGVNSLAASMELLAEALLEHTRQQQQQHAAGGGAGGVPPNGAQCTGGEAGGARGGSMGEQEVAAFAAAAARLALQRLQAAAAAAAHTAAQATQEL